MEQRADTSPRITAPTGNGATEDVPRPQPEPTASLAHELWAFWKAYTHRASAYQSAILLSLIYYLVLGPSAILAQLTGKQLLPQVGRPATSFWMPRLAADKSIASLQRPF